MKNKTVFILAGAVAIILIAYLAFGDQARAPGSEESANGTQTSTQAKTGGKTSVTTAAGAKSNQTKTVSASAPALPNLEFIDARMVFPLKDYPDVKVTVEKVAFGRGETVVSTGCSGIPNSDFSAYLYPGSGICISADKVDGSPRGIVAFHLRIDNNGNTGFGGNSDALRLHYLRADASGKLVFRFAYALSGLASYYIPGYSSKQVVLSYLVPEDQKSFNLVSGYQEPPLEKQTLNVYDFSTSGLLVDWGSKTLKIVK